jgi:hypothetical protein
MEMTDEDRQLEKRLDDIARSGRRYGWIMLAIVIAVLAAINGGLLLWNALLT